MDVVVHKLITWYKKNKRNLPWRHTRDPYAIFISELMLQQTQVDRVIPKYLAWMKRFPSWEILSRATTASIIHAWSGLGYNRRGLYAQSAAMHIHEHGIPISRDAWLQVKGVGPYMVSAIMEFAFHKREIVIDTNIRRIIGRIFLKKPFSHPADDRKIKRVLNKITPIKNGHWILPQAIMDFANTVCLNSKPLCETCPMRNQCTSATFFLKGGKKQKKHFIKSYEKIHEGKKYPDRIYRGRILKLILEKKAISIKKLGVYIDPSYTKSDATWVKNMIKRLAEDGLISIQHDMIQLPT